MSESTTSPVEAAPTRPSPRGPRFNPFAPRLEPFEPEVFDGELSDDDPTETMERPNDDDSAGRG